MKKIILCACVLLITSPLLSFIPKSIKKVAILDFSGSDDSGVYFSLLLRKKMKKQANFIVTEKAILAKMEQSYPYPYEQKFNPKLIKDIGLIHFECAK
jgi:CDP-glycerol glycerophosphotransferase (TagB/SpsB family)